jgi:hypothetical protein
LDHVIGQQKIDGVMIGGGLKVRVETAGFTDDADTLLRSRGTVGKVVFGVTRRNPPKLWIRTPMIHFDGFVAAGGPDLNGWKAGYLQCITQDSWTGHYADGKEVKYRLNTDRGPLKDGMANSLFYENYAWLNEFQNPKQEPIHLHDADALRVMFWTEYSGDPFHPSATGSRGNLLVMTSGSCHFRTFFGAVNKPKRLIVTLAECRWTVTFDGKFDFANQQWTPRGSPEMIDFKLFDAAATYRNPGSSAALPFSLLLDVATQYVEIETPNGWLPCNLETCQPDPTRRDLPTHRRWGESVG